MRVGKTLIDLRGERIVIGTCVCPGLAVYIKGNTWYGIGVRRCRDQDGPDPEEQDLNGTSQEDFLRH